MLRARKNRKPKRAKDAATKRAKPKGLTHAEATALLERRKRVADAYCRGLTQWEIARKEGVNQSQISRDLDHIRQEWLAAAVRDFDTIKSEQLAKIDRIEIAAWDGYERSCKDEETRHATTTTGRAGNHKGNILKFPDLTKATKTVRGQAGDPRFLDRIAWCVETRLKVIGALIQKHEHTGKDGKPIEITEIVIGPQDARDARDSPEASTPE